MTWTITDNTHREIFEELEKQTDRGTAIIGAALLESRVEDAIKSRLLINKTTTSRSIGTFSAKISLGYSMGIYGEKTHHELEIIRKIRNDFAHFLKPINFDSPNIKDKCNELWFPKFVEINHQALRPIEARVQYLRSINILNSLLWQATKTNETVIPDPPASLP